MNIGDVVRLKSGGPVMTVVAEWRDPNGATESLGCYGFLTTGGAHSGTYPPKALELVEPAGGTAAPAEEINRLKEALEQARAAESGAWDSFNETCDKLKALRDAHQKLEWEHHEALADLVAARSRIAELAAQVNVAGALGVKWKWEGGVCRATIKDDELRVQLACLADFHDKVAALLR